jgi:hypothetical protein
MKYVGVPFCFSGNFRDGNGTADTLTVRNSSLFNKKRSLTLEILTIKNHRVGKM